MFIADELERMADSLDDHIRFRTERMSQEGLINLACTWLLSVPADRMGVVLRSLNKTLMESERQWIHSEKARLLELERQTKEMEKAGLPWDYAFSEMGIDLGEGEDEEDDDEDGGASARPKQPRGPAPASHGFRVDAGRGRARRKGS